MDYCQWIQKIKIMYEKKEDNGIISFEPVETQMQPQRIACDHCRADLMIFEHHEIEFVRAMEDHNLRCCRRCIACEPNEARRDPKARQCRVENCPIDYGQFPEVPECWDRCPHIPQ